MCGLCRANFVALTGEIRDRLDSAMGAQNAGFERKSTTEIGSGLSLSHCLCLVQVERSKRNNPQFFDPLKFKVTY